MAHVNALLEPLLTISISLNCSLAIESTNFFKTDLKDGTIFTRGSLDKTEVSFSNFEEIAKRINGVIVQEDAEYIRICVDPFRTIPIFFCEHNGIFISSDIRDCIDKQSERELDAAGFWESIKYGICLGTRTLFDGVNQLIGASYLKICKADLSYAVVPYWDYRALNKLDVGTMSDAVSKLDATLRNMFSNKIGSSSIDKFIMGVSGGLDSRLTLNYMTGFVPAENFIPFTFANDSRSLEYQYSQDILRQARFNEPHFCKLTDAVYKKSLHDLSIQSAGHINLIHGHISFCLENLRNKHAAAYVQISNYFSDALFGWCCVYPSQSILCGFNDMVKDIQHDNDIPSDVKQKISNDLECLFNRGNFSENTTDDYSSFFEYFYLVEKNIKMHSYLMHLQSLLFPVLPIYADFDLANFMLSMPLKYRRGKDVVYELLKTKSVFSGYSVGNISSRDFRGATNKLSWKTWVGIKFKMANRIHSLMTVFGLNDKWLYNKSQTEDILGVYHRQFRPKMQSACQYLIKHNIIDKNIATSRFRPIRIRPKTVGENLQILSIVESLKTFDDIFVKP